MRVFTSLILVGLTTAGCARYDNILRSEPGIHVPESKSGQIAIATDIDPYIDIYALTASGRIIGLDGAEDEQVIYYSVDMTKLMAADLSGAADQKVARNKILHVLMLVSDLNSETYLSRAFAVKLYARGLKGGVQRVMTAVQTTLTEASPATSAGLGISNLLVSGLVDEFDDIVYAKETFDAVQASIQEERAKIKTEILKNMELDYSKYSIQQAISDIRRLAEASSIRNGVSTLVKKTKNQAADAENKLAEQVRAQ